MKSRLDIILVNRGLAPSREKARALIMSGNVFVRGQREDKAGAMFDENEPELFVKENPLPYVSRGGLKLEKALKVFGLSVEDLICMDIGASTGGFTDVMLQNGAKKVYAIDVGHGQLDWRLRNDPRVVCMERVNFRNIPDDAVPESVGFSACDVSFISLSKIFPRAYYFLENGSPMVCLIKPQFEAGREKVGKKGVVRDKNVHREVILSVSDQAVQNGFRILGLSFSPIRGPEGNIEYLLQLKKEDIGDPEVPAPAEAFWPPGFEALVDNVIKEAHESFSRN
ncbi:MAG: TlyA family RNA methyltransferase [Lachnospiraceae bacterium]|nr:TlyA family RNA methyltransferase [Lachnospiraceae bacterium]